MSPSRRARGGGRAGVAPSGSRAASDAGELTRQRELLRKLRRIEMFTERLVAGRLAGQYHSVFKGRGIEPSEVRAYAPGDDVRAIDWNVSARTGAPHVKLFAEERDRTVLLVIDMSASLAIGSRAQTKREVAAEVAALIAFSAIENDDRVGLVIATERVERFVPPGKGRRHVLRVIREILTHRAQSRGTDLGAALEFVGAARGRRLGRRAVVFVISDFLGEGWERPLAIARRRHDMIPVIVSDPIEEALPDLGLVAFADVETGEVIEVDTGGPEARRYAERVAALRAERDAGFRRARLDVIDVRTDRPYLDALVAFFRARKRRIARS